MGHSGGWMSWESALSVLMETSYARDYAKISSSRAKIATKMCVEHHT